MLLAGLVLDIPQFWPSAKIGQVLRKVMSLGECESGAAVLEKLGREHSCVGRMGTVPQSIIDLITQVKCNKRYCIIDSLLSNKTR